MPQGWIAASFPLLVGALDVRARSAISGTAFMKLILAVFAIAGLLILLWALLWIRGNNRRRDQIASGSSAKSMRGAGRGANDPLRIQKCSSRTPARDAFSRRLRL
jgi:hypothetical protein